MQKLVLFVAPLLLFLLVEAQAGPYFKDPALQNELDRLIAEAIDRNTDEQPNRKEYERYYKIRKFMMDHADKSRDASTTTTEAPPPRVPTTPHYLNQNWWSSRQQKTWDLADVDPARIAALQDRNGKFRQFPRLTYTNAE